MSDTPDNPNPSRPGWLRHIPPVEARAAVISIAVSILLVGIKFWAYFLTSSDAIFSDALENVVNVLASGFALFSLTLAHTPADEDHPYGHGKVEFFSAGFEGGMIFFAAIVILTKAVGTIVSGNVHVEELGIGLLLTALATAINGGVGLFLVRLGKKQNSVTLEADGHHLLSDAVTSIAALCGLGVVKFFNFPLADPLAALLIAAYIGYVGVSLVIRSVAGLMDRQDAADTKLLTEMLDAHVQGASPRICSYHKLRHRHTGRYHWVEFHLVLPAHYNLEQGHNIASAIEHLIEQRLGEGNATAHIEPCQAVDCANCRLPANDIPPPPPHRG